MCLKIIHPYGVSYAVVDDDASDEEIARVVKIATTVKEGNGNGRIELRDGAVDGRFGY